MTFTPAGLNETVVQLVHSGWEHRSNGAQVRPTYDSGWDPVIARYAQLAAMSALPG